MTSQETSRRVRLTLDFDGQVGDEDVQGIVEAALLAVADAYDAAACVDVPGSAWHTAHVDFDDDGRRVIA